MHSNTDSQCAPISFKRSKYVLDACHDCCPNDNETFQPFRPALYSLLWYVHVHVQGLKEELVGGWYWACYGIRSQGIILDWGAIGYSYRHPVGRETSTKQRDTRVETSKCESIGSSKLVWEGETQ